MPLVRLAAGYQSAQLANGRSVFPGVDAVAPDDSRTAALVAAGVLTIIDANQHDPVSALFPEGGEFLGAYSTLPNGTPFRRHDLVTEAGTIYSRNADGVKSGAFVAGQWTAVSVESSVLPSTQQTENYTLALADAGTVVEINNAAARTVTIPPNSTVAFPVGSVVEVARMGAGTVTLVAGAGVTIRSRGGLLAIGNQYAAVSARKRATDEWVAIGDLA